MSSWNQKHLNELQKSGKIRGFVIPEKRKNYSADQQKIPAKKPKGLIWLDWNLQYWCNQHALTLQWEYKFCEDREYRSDYAIPGMKVLVEYEGGIFMARSGHNSPSAIQRDIDKYALAVKLGYTVIRVTALTYTTVLKTLNEMI